MGTTCSDAWRREAIDCPNCFLRSLSSCQLPPRCRIVLKCRGWKRLQGSEARGRSIEGLTVTSSTRSRSWFIEMKKVVEWKTQKLKSDERTKKFELETSTETGWTIKLQLESSTSTLPPTSSSSSSLFESVSPTAFRLGNAVIWVRRFLRLSIQKQGYIGNVEWISAFSEFGWDLEDFA